MKFSLAICLLACLVAVVAAVPAQPRRPKLGAKLGKVNRQFDHECLSNYPPGLEFCCYPGAENTPFCAFNRL
ncbi:unnamed protein product [Chondrus crispus]|uniref:Uncharacterized protein n=1 Tax=Chondrus crispus TaxID=2769 RepID=R7QTS4_CHOCR|nr:unnamed protein product [Chondrus crispus]CDF40906.1 unnamed protein product [Chondrus crispus]|eukprot:XP_005711200.1 unnamed protein product [Chondrus crispus]